MPGSVREDGLVASARGPRADRPKRRTFTPAYKLAIVEQYDQLADGRDRGESVSGTMDGGPQAWRFCASHTMTLMFTVTDTAGWSV